MVTAPQPAPHSQAEGPRMVGRSERLPRHTAPYKRSWEAPSAWPLSPERLHPIFCGSGALLAEGEHLGVSTALLPTPSMKRLKKQWLEVLSIYQYVLRFVFLGPFFALVSCCLLLTSLWYLPVLYLVWLFLDWDTAQQGGRRYQWLKNCTVWKHLSDYFPIKLVDTVELPPDRNYVLVSHPHGVIAVGSFCNFATEGTGSSQQFPRLWFSLAMLNGLLYMPVYRDYFLSYGEFELSDSGLDFILSQPQLSQAVVIMVGGAHKALHAIPGEHCFTLQNRKGFVRLALRHGVSLVTVYSFGENDVFRVTAFAPDSWQHLFQLTIKKFVGISPCIFWGRGLFSAKSWGLVPLARPITTVGECPCPGKKAAISCACSRGPSPDCVPLSLQWAAPSRCPSARSPPRSRWTSITGCT
ncbi:LOW QUALITY PROTEIN: 2-acylglycerol O-acyltransferase 3-like [Moschus berezovskii]|uniref:LOW QUALITY PROTEIN: 2-acylglycerol O-acyltransferase 3-like n=1 Tax=Moschus berezovskii TaxID=68408 RepID=UPI002444D86C|nr:LOW QUALITY PROTEIN: 2-acylglycerol O-acyltransferase 3-like [Moschus berezovskii]